jgi:predicted DNA-binding ribbon-helix-helix protein
MKSLVTKRSVAIAGRKTSISLESDFWTALKEIAHGRDQRLSDLVAVIDSERTAGNLSSAVRLFVLEHFRSKIAPEGMAARPLREAVRVPTHRPVV